MNGEQILAILNDWNFWNTEQECGVPRERYVAQLRRVLDSGQVVVITGPRRSGKSVLMRQLARSLVASGVSRERTLLINFEDPRWPALDAAFLGRIVDCYRERVHREGKPFVFLDEVQEVEGWEKWVRMVHELDRATVVISGSNAKLLSRELSSLLTGRHVDQLVLPLSFAERLRFADVHVEASRDAPADPIAAKKTFAQMLALGAFPGTARLEHPEEVLLAYYDDILTKDIAARHHVRKREELKTAAGLALVGVSPGVGGIDGGDEISMEGIHFGPSTSVTLAGRAHGISGRHEAVGTLD